MRQECECLDDDVVDGRDRAKIPRFICILSLVKGVKSCTLINKRATKKIKKSIKWIKDFATPQKRRRLRVLWWWFHRLSRHSRHKASRALADENFNIDGFLLFSCALLFLERRREYFIYRVKKKNQKFTYEPALPCHMNHPLIIMIESSEKRSKSWVCLSTDGYFYCCRSSQILVVRDSLK